MPSFFPAVLAGFSIFFGGCCWGLWILFLLPIELPSPPLSPQIFDRDGELLFLGISTDEQYSLPLTFSEISPFFVSAVVLAEDQRFWEHEGFDLLAFFRALGQNIWRGDVVSGGSTLSQQLAKMLRQPKARNISEKIQELLLSVRLSRHFSKEEIFAAWANRASFSGNIRGVEAASKIFFEKKASELLPEEAALLAILPQNPSQRPDRQHLRKIRLLDRMHDAEILDENSWMRAKNRPLKLEKHFPEKQAPHFVAWLREMFPEKNFFSSSLSLSLQKKVEKMLQEHLRILGSHQAHNGAVMIVENATGAVLVYVGSADFTQKDIHGEVDILRSFRSVGSTLKPFVYLRAFEKWGWSGETIVFDEPRHFPADRGNFFEPKNYDLLYRGPLSVRSALAESRNIPAVSTLNELGISDFLRFVQEIGAEFLSDSPENSGLGIALGAAEMRLVSLGKLYALLAREGHSLTLCFSEKCPAQRGRSLFSPEAAREITDILSDNVARIPAFSENSPLDFPFPVAAKTGTSRNFTDNVVAGYTKEVTVLVWIGNADAAAMQGVSGISGAGPLFHDIFLLLSRSLSQSDFPGTTLPKNFLKPDPLRLLTPLSGSRFLLDRQKEPEEQKILFRSNTEADFFLNGVHLGRAKEILWTPSRGKFLLEIQNGPERTESTFWVEERKE